MKTEGLNNSYLLVAYRKVLLAIEILPSVEYRALSVEDLGGMRLDHRLDDFSENTRKTQFFHYQIHE